MIEKISGYCKNTWNFVYEQGYSVYELILKVLQKQDEIIDEVNDLENTIQTKYDVLDSKKLDVSGNFLGTWFSESKTSMDQRIENGQNLYDEVIELINSSPELNIEIIDGGFFADLNVREEIDAGSFTEVVTEEIDAGLFIYPCQCS